MLLFQYPCRERCDCVLLLYCYLRLQHHRTAIDGLGDKVDAGTVLFTSGFQCAPVCIHAGECRQQGGMNIQHPPLVMVYKPGGQYAHEACQYDKPGLEAFNARQ